MFQLLKKIAQFETLFIYVECKNSLEAKALFNFILAPMRSCKSDTFRYSQNCSLWRLYFSWFGRFELLCSLVESGIGIHFLHQRKFNIQIVERSLFWFFSWIKSGFNWYQYQLQLIPDIKIYEKKFIASCVLNRMQYLYICKFSHKKIQKQFTCVPGKTGIGWLTGSSPNLILFALWLSFSQAEARICSACTLVRCAGVGLVCWNY